MTYLEWIDKIAKQRNWNVSDMLNDDTYDYKVFFDNQRNNALGLLNNNPESHFSDIGKTAKHPTFSDESIYSGRKSLKNTKGIIGGHWYGDNIYRLSQSQIDNNWDIPRTIRYLSIGEPNGAKLQMPNGSHYVNNDGMFGGVLPEITITAKKKNNK